MTVRTHTLTLANLCQGLALPCGELPMDALGRIEIANAVIDSRLASRGSLFIALKGAQHNGHDFVGQAMENGAVAAIVEREVPIACATLPSSGGGTGLGDWVPGDPLCFIVPDALGALQQAAAHWRRQHEVRVVGITGSVGKTTTKEVIAAVLRQRYRTLKNEGNYNNEIGLPLSLLHLSANHQRVVLEMGMYDVGEIAHLASISLPHVGVVTNVGPSHLERLGSIDNIAQAKAELPEALPPAGEGGVAILNADDDRVRAMARQTQARVFTYGLSQDADLWADDIEGEGLEGIHFSFHYGRETIFARVPLLGRHSVHTALRAAAVGLVEGLSWEEIISGLRDESSQLRLVAVRGPEGSTILDDTYNASPTSTIAALGLLDELAKHEQEGRRIAVLGDMYELGSHEEEGHKLVGRRARDVTDVLVTVGALGRTIGHEALRVGMPVGAVHMAETNAQAIELLRDLIKAGVSGDKVLVKGSRGLAMEEIVSALQEGEST
jgi:UDP-N-acetylmuramoyl-tripeptide--D-alanyl-D-alanine ligase